MAAGQSSNSTNAVMDVLDNFARKIGREDVIDSPLWKAFRSKNTDEVIPHAIANLKELNLFDNIISKFGQGFKL